MLPHRRYPVAAVSLRLIQGHIRRKQQFLSGLSVFRVHCHPQRQGNRTEQAAAIANPKKSRFFAKFFGALLDVFQSCLWQHQKELLASVTTGEIPSPDMFFGK